MRRFRTFGLHEFAPRRGLVKKIRHFYTRSTGHPAGRLDSPALNAPGFARTRGFGLNDEFRNGIDRCQCFPAKTQRRCCFQISERGHFARRVAFHRQRQFRFRNTAAVVAHQNP